MYANIVLYYYSLVLLMIYYFSHYSNCIVVTHYSEYSNTYSNTYIVYNIMNIIGHLLSIY